MQVKLHGDMNSISCGRLSVLHTPLTSSASLKLVPPLLLLLLLVVVVVMCKCVIA